MPISINDLNELVTKGDLVQFLNQMKSLFESTKEKITQEMRQFATSTVIRPKFLTPAQFCQCLAELPHGRRVSVDTVRRWCKEGSVKAAQEGGANSTWLIPYEELDRIHANASMIEPERPR
jgi:hypothetical protein